VKRPDGFKPADRSAAERRAALERAAGDREASSPRGRSVPSPVDEQSTDILDFDADRLKKRSANTAGPQDSGTAKATPVKSGPAKSSPAKSGAVKSSPAKNSPTSSPEPELDPRQTAKDRKRHEREEIRRFTARRRSRNRAWLIVAAVFVALVVFSIAGAYSPLMAVRTVEVVGASRVDAAALSKALDGQLGRPLSLVDASEVKAVLVTYPLIASYSLESRPPGTLVVRVVEREPVGIVQGSGGFTLVDAAGVSIQQSTTAIPGYPLLEVTGGAGSPGFTAAADVLRALPADLRARVAKVNASTADDVTLTLADVSARIVWGSAEDSGLKAIVLARALGSIDPNTVNEFDLSSPSNVVTR
jgi:cell division protein FtsQ